MNSELTAVVSSNNDITVGWLMKNSSACLVNLKLICEAQGAFKKITNWISFIWVQIYREWEFLGLQMLSKKIYEQI